MLKRKSIIAVSVMLVMCLLFTTVVYAGRTTRPTVPFDLWGSTSTIGVTDYTVAPGHQMYGYSYNTYRIRDGSGAISFTINLQNNQEVKVDVIDGKSNGIVKTKTFSGTGWQQMTWGSLKNNYEYYIRIKYINANEGFAYGEFRVF